MYSLDSSYVPDPPDAHLRPTEIGIDQISRWDVYNRLQELAIPCECHCGTPLQVQITTATDAIQLWSVVQHLTSSKQVTIGHLERCWQQRYSS
jgi:hypothetical protein